MERAPDDHKEVSEAERKSLEDEARPLLERVEKERVGGGESLLRITGNLAQGIQGPLMIDPARYTPRMHELATINIKALKTYFALLDDFPDFAEVERTPGRSFFDLYHEISDPRVLVAEYERRLRA